MERFTDLGAQVKSICDLLHQYQGLDRRQLKRIAKKGFFEGFAKSIVAGDLPQFAGHTFYPVTFRQVDGKEVRSVLPVDRRIKVRQGLRVFVGHRFTPGVTESLRHNLTSALMPYGIKTWYSDSDSPNGPVFQIILDRIDKADFAVFDDRETETRPNTLIEIGVAVGLDKPHFYFNYEKKRMVQVGSRRERITTASDLSGMLYMPYGEYDVLFREFAVRLPLFLSDRKFARRILA